MLSGPLIKPERGGDSGTLFVVQAPVKEGVQKLRQEIAEIANANRGYVNSNGKNPVAEAEQERRLQRLKEIMDEWRALTDWKET